MYVQKRIIENKAFGNSVYTFLSPSQGWDRSKQHCI